MTAADRCSRMIVVVPVHDEQRALPQCLAALRVAARALPPSVTLDCWVVLDDCTDGSAEIARAAGVRTHTIAARNVGIARHVGALAALAAAQTPLAAVWLACTDADSIVPAHWLSTHLAAADDGWDTLAGTVRVEDWTGHPAPVRRRFDRVYRPVPGHHHVHGANLGIAAAAYVRVGGYPPLRTAEDVGLLTALRRGQARILRSATAPVTTSARLCARAPRGFAHRLRSLH